MRKNHYAVISYEDKVKLLGVFTSYALAGHRIRSRAALAGAKLIPVDRFTWRTDKKDQYEIKIVKIQNKRKNWSTRS